MKNHALIGSFALALGLLGLMAGCASQSTGYSARVRQARDFEIVETSSKRTLTPQEMEHLRAKVTDYLARQGVTETGDYYLKIHLGAEQGATEGEWVVVRYTRQPATRVELLASYPDYYDNRSTYAYDYYPFSPYGFGRLSFQYYDYPYYGYPHYPPFRRHHHGHGHHGNHRPDRDDDPKPPRDNSRPSGALKPSFIPSHSTANTRPGEDVLTAGRSRRYDSPNQPAPGQRWRNRTGSSSGAPSLTPGLSFNQTSSPEVPPISGAPSFKPFRPVTVPGGADHPLRRPNHRPDRDGTASVPRAPGARERHYSDPGLPRQAHRPGHEARSDSSSGRSQPALKPSAPAPRVQPAPTQSQPVARSEARSTTRSDSDSSSHHRTNTNDGGRRAREP